MHLLNADAIVSPLHAVRFSEEQVFLRPTQDTKHFSGRVLPAKSSWPGVRRRWTFGDQSHAGHEVQYSRPVQICAEYRFWIVAGEIITHSMYRRGPQVFYTGQVDERLAQFVRDRVHESSANAFS